MSRPQSTPLLAHGCDTEDTTSERYTRALMRLTREVWHPDCGFDTAVALICEVAAHTLRVDRTNVWRYEPERHRLQCTHAYSTADRRHARPDELESLVLASDYEMAFGQVRAIDLCEIDEHVSDRDAPDGLYAYLKRHRIRALLDAPVCIEGETLGVICHEHVGERRDWTNEEKTFAGSMGDFVAMAHQIARRHQAERDLRHLRLHDPTTDLPNRDCMLELVGQRLRALHPVERQTAIVHLGIQAMHDIALTPGTQTQEDLMAQVALQLRRVAGHQLSLGRVRTDAFALLVPRDSTQDDVLRLAGRCIVAVRELPRDGETFDPAASAGIAFSDVDERDADVLLRKAEQASERAREHGRDRVEVFDLEHHAELLGRMRTERALRNAFERGDLELHYQPEYDLVRRRWSGAEALLRWRHDGRLRPAAEFIEIAEASELILPLGRWALRRACHEAAAWPANGGPPPTVRVNVSARQFEQGMLVDDVAQALADSGLASRRLCLEITETTLMHDVPHALEQLERLRGLGIELAIDDFGAGYSSLTYLKRLPVAVLKIDRSFVRGLPDDRADVAIVAAVVALAQSLGLEVVAEGVETSEQESALVDAGVGRAQGWLYAQALEPARWHELLGTPRA